MLIEYPEDAIVTTVLVLPGQLRLISEDSNQRMHWCWVELIGDEWPSDRAIRAWCGMPGYAHVDRGMVEGRAFVWVAK